MGIDSINNEKAYHVRYTLDDQRIDNYYSTTTNLLIAQNTEIEGKVAEVLLSEYLPVDGIHIPHKGLIKSAMIGAAESIIDSVKFNAPVSEVLFAVDQNK